MKVFSLFSGVGGFEQGLPEDWEIVGFSEIDKYASQVLKYHYPNTKNYGNCAKIKWSEVPNFDLLTGGSPCQDFSIAGKRAGIVGSRSGLVWEYIRCLKEKQPRYFIWENVKGLLSSRKGFDFASILTAFSESGYSLWWQVLNAKDFGVPQNRERIFVVGFRDENPPEIFFERKSNEVNNGESGNKLREQVANTIRTNYSNGFSNETYIEVQNKGASQHYRVYGQDGLAPTLQSQSGMSSQKHPFIVAQRGRNPQNPKSRKLGLKTEQMLEPNLTGNSNTLTGVEKDNYVFDGKVRKLMPIECERLMSWQETVFYVKIELCLDQVNNYVNAVRQNPKLQKYVGTAEKHAKKLLAKFVGEKQPINSVQENVIINGKKIEKSKIPNKSLNAEFAESQNELDLQKLVDFVPLNVSISLTEGQTINDGLAELQAFGGEQILQFNGKDVLNLYGKEIMQLAKGAEINLDICLRKNFIPITLEDLKINLQDLMLIILYLFAINAIGGYTPKKISKENLSLTFRIGDGGWTQWGIDEKGNKVKISDSQRYKMCGNGVVSNVVKEIIKALL